MARNEDPVQLADELILIDGSSQLDIEELGTLTKQILSCRHFRTCHFKLLFMACLGPNAANALKNS